MKTNLNQEDKRRLVLNGRRLAISLLVLLFVIYAFIVFSIAWFSGGSKVSAGQRMLEVAGLSTRQYALYEWQGSSETEGSWVEVPTLDYSDGVPNEVRRYMIASNLTFKEIQFAFSDTIKEADSTESLYDYVYIKTMSQNVDGAVIDDTTQTVSYDYGGVTPSYFSYADKATTSCVTQNSFILAGDSAKAVVFDVYISRDVCNFFSLWGFKGSIRIK